MNAPANVFARSVLRPWAISATLLVLAQTGGFAAEPGPGTEPAVDPKIEELLKKYQKDAELVRSSRTAAGEYYFAEGQRARQETRMNDAVEAFTRAVDYQPDNKVYREALSEAKGLAGLTRDPVSTHNNAMVAEKNVLQQSLWHDATQHLANGERQLAAGEYVAAERSFTLAQTRLDVLPFADERREPELRRAATLLETARTRKAEAERQSAAERNRSAVDQGEALRREALRIERDRIDAMLARAQRARDRRDYDEAILLCDQVLKINRAESRASSLRASCWRDRAVYVRQLTADTWEESHKRLVEDIRRDMLPQLEILRYSTEWPEIDARRRAPTQQVQSEKPVWQQNIDNQLLQEINTDWSETGLDEVVRNLQQITGANIILDPKLTTPPTVTMRVDKMKLRNVLDFIMKVTALKYVIKDDAIFISSSEGAQGASYMKIYDIRDLTHQLKSFPGPEIQLPKPCDSGIQLLPPIDAAPARESGGFIDLMKQIVAPQSWTEAGRTIEDVNGQMVVSQTAEIHQQIDELLRQLRNQGGTQIHVKVKFLEIENAALEQIGVRWQSFNPAPRPGQTPLMPLPGVNTGAPPAGGSVGVPADLGGYYRNGDTVMAGRVNGQLLSYTNDRTLPAPLVNEGLQFSTQYWQVAQNFFARAILDAVEKERKGNVLYEPDLTLFSGQQGHIVQLNQQAYISDYNQVSGNFDPVIDTVSYGTVLDVFAVASSDHKFITMTLRPTNARIRSWRRFSNVANDNAFPGAVQPERSGPGIGSLGEEAGVILDNPLLVPELDLQRVQTTVNLPDGGSMVLAGLTDSSSSRAHSGVPFLSHIPFLGRLFSTNGRQDTERKTLIIVQADLVLFDEIEKSL